MDSGDTYFNVVLQWIDQTLDIALYQNYIITISVDPPSTVNSGIMFQTTNTSVQLALLYNQDYNISVLVRNCTGTSAPAIIHIRIIQSDNCTLIVKDGIIIMDYCLSSATTTTMDEVTVSNFTTDSALDLATQQHGSSMHIIINSYKCDPFIIH